MLAVGVTTFGFRCKAAETITVETLLIYCNDREESGNWSNCLGYVSGIGDMMNVNRQLVGSAGLEAKQALAPMSICGGTNLTYGAWVQAFRNWAKKHPEQWNDPASLGVASALRELWPCG